MNFKEFMFEKYDLKIQYDIDNMDNDFIKKLENELSFLYRKRKERYIRPHRIVGSMGDEIDLRLNMTNKDILLINFKDEELKVTINGDIIYHMDEFKKEDVIEKVEKLYRKYIEQQNFTVMKKINPFK